MNETGGDGQRALQNKSPTFFTDRGGNIYDVWNITKSFFVGVDLHKIYAFSTMNKMIYQFMFYFDS